MHKIQWDNSRCRGCYIRVDLTLIFAVEGRDISRVSAANTILQSFMTSSYVSICSLLTSFFFLSSLFFPSSYGSSSSSSSCSSLMLVDYFFTDVDECTASTSVCGIHFNGINTLGSYRCEYKYSGESCHGKKSTYHVFLFVAAQLNSFEAR